MNAKRAVAAIHDEDGLAVRRDVGEDGFAPGRCARDDGARFSVNREEGVVPRSCYIDVAAVGRKIEGVGKRPHGDARGDLIDAGIEDPDVAAGCAHAENLGAGRMLAHSGKARADGDAGDGCELHEIEDGDAAVRGGDVGGEMQVRAQEGGAMLAEKQDNPADGQRGEQEVDAKVLGAVHEGLAIVAREEAWNEARRWRLTACKLQREGWDSKEPWKSF